MKPFNDGGPAFPIPGLGNNGLSIRDYFAAHALTGYFAMHADPECDGPFPDMAAQHAYEFADAMLEARKPKG